MIYRIGIKYCGGCMPEYDRNDLFEALHEVLTGKVNFVSWKDPDTTATLVMAGCPNACADIESFSHKPVFIIKQPEDAQPFINLIESEQIDELAESLQRKNHIGS